ncbi:MAG TPA: hemin uptake protein HemP [Paucimonas sp.]|nr:hemin uptake protein HemP [Paucimonas sp.]
MTTETSGKSTKREQSVRVAEASAGETTARIMSRELFRQGREVEIDHEGRIYRLRLTQLNKLILTA